MEAPDTAEFAALTETDFITWKAKLAARGVKVPDNDWVYHLYALGFQNGALWGLDYAKKVMVST